MKEVADGANPNEKNKQCQAISSCHLITFKICVDRIEWTAHVKLHGALLNRG